jgi:hypothetical protein
MYGILLFFGGVVVGVAIEHFFLKKDVPCDDNGGKERQKIYDDLSKVIDDLEKTV